MTPISTSTFRSKVPAASWSRQASPRPKTLLAFDYSLWLIALSTLSRWTIRAASPSSFVPSKQQRNRNWSFQLSYSSPLLRLRQGRYTSSYRSLRYVNFSSLLRYSLADFRYFWHFPKFRFSIEILVCWFSRSSTIDPSIAHTASYVLRWSTTSLSRILTGFLHRQTSDPTITFPKCFCSRICQSFKLFLARLVYDCSGATVVYRF